MTKRSRSPTLKVKVMPVAIKDEEALIQLAERFKVHGNLTADGVCWSTRDNESKAELTRSASRGDTPAP